VNTMFDIDRSVVLRGNQQRGRGSRANPQFIGESAYLVSTGIRAQQCSERVLVPLRCKGIARDFIPNGWPPEVTPGPRKKSGE